MLRGNKILYAKSGSNAQHGMLKNLFQSRWADLHGAWYVAWDLIPS